MEYFPVFLNLRGRRVLIDGGGMDAARRAERALQAGAEVAVFDPEPGEALRDLAPHPALQIETRPPDLSDIAGCVLAYGASDDDTRDARLRSLAETAGVPCNVADAQGRGDFLSPSVVDRSPIVLAISTGGTAPVIARLLRARLETTLPAAFGRLAEFAGGFRDRATRAFPNARERRHFWERLIDGPAGDLFMAGQEDRARARIDADLTAGETGARPPQGEVYLVGAGPGDPDLLTFRALRLMQRADVVLYDRLLGNDILSLVRREAKRINVGKRAKDHTMAQEDISQLLVRLAREGNRVLRLKGGDPFIFGRGGEEIEALAEQGIPFQVVPGITAASGCATYAGIPLTHRDHAQSCTFVTAHGRDGVLELDWDILIRPGQTVAVYMGLSSLRLLTDGFAARGVDMSVPVAVVANGTRPNQEIVTGAMHEIADLVDRAGLKSPAMIIIGSVVTLRTRLNWGPPEDDTHRLGVTAGETPDLSSALSHKSTKGFTA